ncbi:MAG TPA: hypothetical protein VEH04_15795 [Verrucomicrobiae bacterium]|nr:hypothetical protein [Verrucomicrobiae bacterium]
MLNINKARPTHVWRFFRAGGFDQVRLDSGADLMRLDELDQKLWVALASPASGLEFDPKTLALVDADKDGRIRAPELIAAVKWAGGLLKNPDVLVKGGDSVPLDAISTATPEGEKLLASARQINENLGNAQSPTIALADASDATRIFANTTFNGDGVIIAESAPEGPLRKVIAEIQECCGTVADRSGKPGIDQAHIDQFFAACAAFDGWTKQGDTDSAALLPLGGATPAASASVKAVKGKVDDYFGRARLAAFDARSLPALNRREEDYAAFAGADLSLNASEAAGFPLAHVAPGKPLSLTTGINPAHAAAMATFKASAVQPLLGDKSELTEADWLALQAKLARYDEWQAAKAGAIVEKLGIARVREILGSDAQQRLGEVIAQDKALEPQASSIANVEKLARYVRDLHRLCENFVNFRDFYDADGRAAIFQCGVLYLDQRACALCIAVEDAAKHALMAGLAGAYLAYCDCVRKATGEKRSIVAIVSNGDSDNLMVGRNGLFYDRKGRDWDATITKIVDNPISLRQAFWSPYKKLVRLIEEQVAKRAAAADAKANEKLASAASATANLDKTGPAPKKVDVGTVAAISVAIAGIGALITSLLGYATGIFMLPFWKLCLVVTGLVLLISTPSMIIAWLKLRKRNLGPILDANGWAVNAKARLNVPFGASLTQVAALPEGAAIATDRFGDAPTSWPKIVLTLVAIAFVLSLLNHFTLLDMIVHKATGRHYPRILKQAAYTPATIAPTNSVPAESGVSTDLPAASN